MSFVSGCVIGVHCGSRDEVCLSIGCYGYCEHSDVLEMWNLNEVDAHSVNEDAFTK